MVAPRFTAGLHDITLPSSVGGSPGLTAVLGVPQGEGPWPAVVVVHEAFGINDVMRRQVERLVSMGYLTLMPNLFTAGGVRKCLTATFRSLMTGEGRAFVDIDTARRWISGEQQCTGAVGVIGFCMGGAFALLTASRGFDVASVNYGQLPSDLDRALAGACPIIASYGAADSSLRGAAARLETALSAAGVEHEVHEYPGAGHSFLNDAESGPWLARPLLRVAGMGPRPEQAKQAWARIDDFLAKHLGQPAG